MKPTIFVTSKLSTGIMYQQLNCQEFVEEIEFITCFSFQYNSEGSLFKISTQFN
jgi:hypothetical protein